MSDAVAKSIEPIEPKICSTCKRAFNAESDFLKNTSRWRVCSSEHLWFNCSCGSTLMIKKGKYPWYSPEKFMSAGAANLFNKLGGLKNFPRIPTAIMEIQELLQKPDYDVTAISTKIRKDPLLAGRLLEVASLIRTSRDPLMKQPFNNIEHAASYIGKQSLMELVTTISLQSFALSTKVFNAQKHWKESFLTAELAELISVKWGKNVSRDEVYVAAALCNIGKIVGAILFPNQIDQVDALTNNPKSPCSWTQSEAINKVPNHMMLGEIGAAIWGLPVYVIDSIGEHHSEQNYKVITTESRALNLVDCVTLANQMTHWILLKPQRISMNLLQKFCKSTKIPMKDIEDFATLHSSLGRRAE